MQDKYEFTYQITYEDVIDISKKLAFKSVICKVNSVNYMLALMSYIFMGHFIGSFFGNIGNYVILFSLILPVWYYITTQNKIKKECLTLPMLQHETTVKVSPLNIQDLCNGNFFIISYKNAEFIETKNTFVFIFNAIMFIPLPKRLFKTPAEIDEFREFVLKNT